MKNSLYKIGLFSLLISICYACDSLLENELPTNQIPTDEAIKNVDDLQHLLNSAYDVLANSYNGNNQRFAELLADNVQLSGNTGFLAQVYNRSSDFFNSDVGTYHGQPYTVIVRANSILENIKKLNLSTDEKNRFEGEAKFLRAICHFELVRLFAQPYGYTQHNSHLGIVIKTSSTIQPLKRSTVTDVYTLIKNDLLEAEVKLPETNGNYATRYSAKAYLAKMYFQMNDFENAATKAREIIDSQNYTFSPDVDNRVRTSPSSEGVFYIVSISTSNRAQNFKDMYRSVNETAPILRVSDEYYSLLKSNTNDARAGWVDTKTYQSASAKVFTKFDADFMNVTLASLTEMKLIAAESYGELNANLPIAEGYLNEIKGRAGIALLNGSSAETIVLQSRLERRKEFGGEGNRIHDLKRIGVLEGNLIVRGAPWDCDGMVLQFPASENSTLGFIMNPQGGCN